MQVPLLDQQNGAKVVNNSLPLEAQKHKFWSTEKKVAAAIGTLGVAVLGCLLFRLYRTDLDVKQLILDPRHLISSGNGTDVSDVAARILEKRDAMIPYQSVAQQAKPTNSALVARICDVSKAVVHFVVPPPTCPATPPVPLLTAERIDTTAADFEEHLGRLRTGLYTVSAVECFLAAMIARHTFARSRAL